MEDAGNVANSQPPPENRHQLVLLFGIYIEQQQAEYAARTVGPGAFHLQGSGDEVRRKKVISSLFIAGY
jgi:hypothetical protein